MSAESVVVCDEHITGTAEVLRALGVVGCTVCALSSAKCPIMEGDKVREGTDTEPPGLLAAIEDAQRNCRHYIGWRSTHDGN